MTISTSLRRAIALALAVSSLINAPPRRVDAQSAESRTARTSPDTLWFDRLKDAWSMAVTDRRPLVIVFASARIPVSEQYARHVLNAPEIRAYANGRAVLVKADPYASKSADALTNKMRVKLLPTIVVIRPNRDGSYTELGRVLGVAKIADSRVIIDAAVARYAAKDDDGSSRELKDELVRRIARRGGGM